MIAVTLIFVAALAAVSFLMYLGRDKSVPFWTLRLHPDERAVLHVLAVGIVATVVLGFALYGGAYIVHHIPQHFTVIVR